MTAAIEIREIVKTFGGATALDRCSLTITAGCVTGIIGPNGAGKTTLLDVLCGLVPPDSGQVLFRGVPITGLPPHAVAARGIVRTFQIVRDLAGLTVLETLLLAPGDQIGETILGALFRRGAVEAQERTRAVRARALLDRIGLWRLADAPAASLSGGQRKLLDLARALMLDPAVLCLDEPAAGVSPPLLDEIIGLIRDLRAAGLTLIIVEHDMHLVREVCDHVHVLAQGRPLVSGTFAEVTADPRVVEAYLGLAA
ncbi:ABC transporter ATP-binding protein [uncultured Methylobacterium sp.]|uniref:ABC transporter ATP-binding protein n=1 Tax=uncultured Methylobacterium sp. TaxID=157278 RepID=UPI0035CB3393